VLVGARHDETGETLRRQRFAQGSDAAGDMRRIARLGKGLEAAGRQGRIGHGLFRRFPRIFVPAASLRQPDELRKRMRASAPDAAAFEGISRLAMQIKSFVNTDQTTACVGRIFRICEIFFSHMQHRSTLGA
jgi:hypothetical protein